MSSLNQPVRRTLRTARPTVAKDTENPTTRATRTSTRAKPPSSSSTGLAGAKAKPSSSTGDKADNIAGKRKRDVLTEVSGVSNHRSTAVAKGGKAAPASQKFDGVVLNKAKVSTTTTARQPLRTVATARQPAGRAQDVDVKRPMVYRDEHAMQVDPLPSITIRESEQDNAKPARPRRVTSKNIKLDTEDDTGPLHKKRRTSSEAPQDDSDVLAHSEVDLLDGAGDDLEVIEEEEEAEADPDGDHWDDLDADDGDDPLMVSEYVVEIFSYLKETELTTMPNPNYMANQKELGWQMRGILADWLIELHARMRLLPETLFLCMNIIDRFLSTRVVSLAKLQLVGVTAMFIASKVEEIMAPAARDFVSEADGAYTETDMFTAERYVLKTLDYNLSYPNPFHFLRRISKADDYNVTGRTLAKFLVEMSCVEWRLLAAPPSLLAAAAMWLARLMMGKDSWDANLAHYSTYAESSLLPTANMMINYVLKPIRHDIFHKKYASKRHMKVSSFARQWAHDRWEEGSQVDLERMLPLLKREIKQAKLEAEREAEDQQALAATTTTRTKARS